MTCTTPGCYAKVFRRNLCRRHYLMWLDVLEFAESGSPRKEPSVASPTPFSAVCACPAPIVMATGMFPGAMQCQRCGKPPIESLSTKGPT